MKGRKKVDESVIEGFRKLVNQNGVLPEEKEAAFWGLVIAWPNDAKLHKQALAVFKKKSPKRGRQVAEQYYSDKN